MRQPIDFHRQFPIALGNPAGIMAGQPEIYPVPDIGEFGVMIDLLGMHRDPREEGESGAEILEFESPHKRLAARFNAPA